MCNHQNKSLYLLEHSHIRCIHIYHNKLTFKALRIIMICNIHIIMPLLRLTHAHNNLSWSLMSNHQNNSLSLLEHSHIRCIYIYHNKLTFKALRIIMICNIHIIMPLLRLTHAHNNLSWSLMSNHQKKSLSLLEHSHIRCIYIYHNKLTFKALRIIMICNILIIMPLLRLTHDHNNLSWSLMCNHQNNSLSLLEHSHIRCIHIYHNKLTFKPLRIIMICNVPFIMELLCLSMFITI